SRRKRSSNASPTRRLTADTPSRSGRSSRPRISATIFRTRCARVTLACARASNEVHLNRYSRFRFASACEPRSDGADGQSDRRDAGARRIARYRRARREYGRVFDRPKERPLDRHRRTVRRIEGSRRRLRALRRAGSRCGARLDQSLPRRARQRCDVLRPRGLAHAVMPARELDATIAAIWRIGSPKLIATLSRLLNDVGRAEDVAQDAFVTALAQWPDEGIPRNPGGWLMTVAKRRAIDDIRRNETLARKARVFAYDITGAAPADDFA